MRELFLGFYDDVVEILVLVFKELAGEIRFV